MDVHVLQVFKLRFYKTTKLKLGYLKTVLNSIFYY